MAPLKIGVNIICSAHSPIGNENTYMKIRRWKQEKRGNERVQDLINEYNKIVDEKLKEKEKDLMTI